MGSQVRSMTYLAVWLDGKIILQRNTNIRGLSSLISYSPLLWPRSSYPLTFCGTFICVAVQKQVDSPAKRSLHKRIKWSLSFCAIPDNVWFYFHSGFVTTLGNVMLLCIPRGIKRSCEFPPQYPVNSVSGKKFQLQLWKTSQVQNLLVYT